MKNDFCINPVLLKWARETIGLSIEMAAKKINVDSDVLKKWEEGIVETPTKKIKKLSEIYKRPTTVFLMNKLIPKSKLVIFEKADHFSFVDQPEEFVKTLINFIDG